MQRRPERPNPDIVTGGMYAVGQKDDNDGVLQIHPERRACKAQMTDTIF